MTTSVGRESCRGEVYSNGVRRTCLAIQYPRPTTGTGGPIGNRYLSPQSQLANGTRRVYSAAGHQPWWWEVDQGAVEDEAASAGVEITALLCTGCRRRRVRLIEEGSWTA